PDHRLFHSVTPDHPQTYTPAGNTGPNQRARKHPLDTKRLRYRALGEMNVRVPDLVVGLGKGSS
ncbi:MAG: hypothetical protein OEM81_13080, partial [Acidimicrobiia bacterium]|nr:hypothetical protein [Acidimicrobiia bacterium]